MNLVIKIFSIILFILYHCQANGIDQVDDTDLMHLLTGEENVVALFTKKNCPECDELEIVVENLHKDLKDALGAVVVKAYNSQLISIYNPSREPSLIYFRKGIPLLYYGETNEDEIMQTFIENRDPVVKELSDENFEHLTQAATGATTGDWFIFFYSADCVFCQRLYAIWEAVGSKLRHKLTVARVNRLAAGISTAKRFSIVEAPEFILLKQGYVYRYKQKEYTPKSFIDFVVSGYQKQTHPEGVPAEPNYMDNFLSNQLNVLAQNTKLWIFVGVTAALIVLFSVLRKSLSAKNSKKEAKKTKKAK